MSIVVPAIVVLQTAIILWLLTRTFGLGICSPFIRPKRPTARANNLECATPAGRAAQGALLAMADKADPRESFVQPCAPAHQHREHHRTSAEVSWAPDTPQSASRTRRPFAERLHRIDSARQARRQTHDVSTRAPLAHQLAAAAIEARSGDHYSREALTLLPPGILMPDARGLMVMVAPLWSDPLPVRQSRGRVPLDDFCASRKDRTEFRVEIERNAFRFEGENVTLAFVIDKTDRYELRRQRQDLVHLTRVSTMGQLASSLAHELNQLLTAIQSNVQAAQRFTTADLVELREILNDIVQDDYWASEMIRRICAVVRKGDLDVILLDLAGVVRYVVARYAATRSCAACA
jgi:two-component system, LuxR family, sensor kinase FixL